MSVQKKDSLSSLSSFSKNPWVVILSLIFGTIGGVPGIINIADYFSKKPTYTYRFSHIVSADIRDTFKNNIESVCIINGAIVNNGERPFFISSFNADLYFDGTHYELNKKAIPKNLNQGIGKFGNLITFENLQEKDFQLITKIPGNELIYGSLMFGLPSSIPSNFDFNACKIKLTCIDIDGNEYKTYINPIKDIDPNLSFPKSGVYVK